MAGIRFDDPSALTRVDDYVTNAPLSNAIAGAAGNWFNGQNQELLAQKQRIANDQAAQDLQTKYMEQQANYRQPLPADSPLRKPMDVPPPDSGVEDLANLQPPELPAQGSVQAPFPAPLNPPVSAAGSAQGMLEQVAGAGGGSVHGSQGAFRDLSNPTELPGLKTPEFGYDKMAIALQKQQLKSAADDERLRKKLAATANGQILNAAVRLRQQAVQTLAMSTQASTEGRLLFNENIPIQQRNEAATRIISGLFQGTAQQFRSLGGPKGEVVDQKVINETAKQAIRDYAGDLIVQGNETGDHSMLDGAYALLDKLSNYNPDKVEKPAAAKPGAKLPQGLPDQAAADWAAKIMATPGKTQSEKLAKVKEAYPQYTGR